MSNISFDRYSGLNPDTGNLVFEEEILKILREKNIEIISKKELKNLIEFIENNVYIDYKHTLEIIQSIPTNQKFSISLIKNLLTSEGRLFVHNKKTSDFNSERLYKGDLT